MTCKNHGSIWFRYPLHLGVPVLLCDYHRVSAWNKWITETRNFIIGSKGALVSILEALSNASTKEMYHKLLEQLQDSSYWKEDERLCKWFGSRWLPCCMVSLFCWLDTVKSWALDLCFTIIQHLQKFSDTKYLNCNYQKLPRCWRGKTSAFFYFLFFSFVASSCHLFTH